MSYRALDDIEDVIQAQTEVFDEEAEHVIPVFLERRILPTVAPVSLGIG